MQPAEQLHAWLRDEARLEEVVVEQAKAGLAAEQVFSVEDLELLRREGGLRDVFKARLHCTLDASAP